MNPNAIVRSTALLNDDGMQRLAQTHVLIVGLGGVGGHAAEALTRCGIGSLTLIDGDTVEESNLNRQLAALHSTLGKNKVDIIAERMEDINPDIHIVRKIDYYSKSYSNDIFNGIDYVLDACDNVSAKVELALQSDTRNVPIISCMGTGNRLDPMQFRIGDVYETHDDPLAKAMRHELRMCGVERLQVVYSTEKPIKLAGTPIPGSVSFVPWMAGLIMAGHIITTISSGIVDRSGI